ncbi:hypothetical protein FB451DRAFT_755702 [Mycena latifolia]|nr:hypothetical protein FB451DRAFT_755702 [Mycena latifolia]
MQVTSLFATFFALLSLVAPLATQALQITAPTNVTTLNVTISFTSDATDPPGFLTFFLVKNTTRDTIAKGIDPAVGSINVTIPANVTGDGWTIQASTSDDSSESAGVSLPFSIAAAAPKAHGGMSAAGGIVGGVIAGIIGLALIVLAVFLYQRRRRQQHPGTTFNLEAGFPPPERNHQRSVSSMSDSFADTTNKSIELDKIQWEMELEEQFARARAGTPDVPRNGSPMPRGASPLRNAPPMPLVPQRAATCDTRY